MSLKNTKDGQERTGNKVMPKPCNMCGYKKYCWKKCSVA